VAVPNLSSGLGSPFGSTAAGVMGGFYPLTSIVELIHSACCFTLPPFFSKLSFPFLSMEWFPCDAVNFPLLQCFRSLLPCWYVSDLIRFFPRPFSLGTCGIFFLLRSAILSLPFIFSFRYFSLVFPLVDPLLRLLVWVTASSIPPQLKAPTGNWSLGPLFFSQERILNAVSLFPQLPVLIVFLFFRHAPPPFLRIPPPNIVWFSLGYHFGTFSL